jgi:hypothetical protein
MIWLQGTVVSHRGSKDKDLGKGWMDDFTAGVSQGKLVKIKTSKNNKVAPEIHCSP